MRLKSLEWVSLSLIFALPGTAIYGQAPHTHQHQFKDAEKWAHVFDDPQRDAWQKPHEVIQALELAPGAVVADIGAGTGYFSARLATMLPKGRVYAVDVEPDMVKHLAQRARKEGRANMQAVQGAFDDPKLPGKADLMLFVDVHHHIDKREQYFKNLQRYLNPGGRVAIIDFRPDASMGPPKHSRIPADKVKAELKAAGYSLAGEHAFLPNQYFLIFRP